jgi:hypothetical protein
MSVLASEGICLVGTCRVFGPRCNHRGACPGCCARWCGPRGAAPGLAPSGLSAVWLRPPAALATSPIPELVALRLLHRETLGGAPCAG